MRPSRSFGFIALVTALIVSLAACGDSKTKPSVAGERNPLLDSADQVMFGVRFNLTDAGIFRAHLVADTGIFLNSNTRVELINVHTTFYNTSGAQDAVLTSKFGTYRTQSGQMTARGAVNIVSEDGKTLNSEHVAFDQRRNEIWSDSAFVVTEPGRRLEGIGFVSDPNLKNVRVLKATSGSSENITIPNQ